MVLKPIHLHTQTCTCLCFPGVYCYASSNEHQESPKFLDPESTQGGAPSVLQQRHKAEVTMPQATALMGVLEPAGASEPVKSLLEQTK